MTPPDGIPPPVAPPEPPGLPFVKGVSFPPPPPPPPPAEVIVEKVETEPSLPCKFEDVCEIAGPPPPTVIGEIC